MTADIIEFRARPPVALSYEDEVRRDVFAFLCTTMGTTGSGFVSLRGYVEQRWPSLADRPRLHALAMETVRAYLADLTVMRRL